MADYTTDDCWSRARTGFFQRLQSSADPEFLAVYGRRRVGKTFLIREYFKPEMVFELTGRHHATLSEHLIDFTHALAKANPKKKKQSRNPHLGRMRFTS